MTESSHAVTVEAGGAAVTIASAHPGPVQWATRYFSPWWNTQVAAQATNSDVQAELAPDTYEQIHTEVLNIDHVEVVYAGSPMLVHTAADGAVLACTPSNGLAYQKAPNGLLHIIGNKELPLNLAASRLAREVLRSKLQSQGWVLLHAAAVVQDGHALLIVGPKGAGKTSTALQLAHAGYHLLANDRVFVRADNGKATAIPWCAAAALGLGLIDALGLYELVQTRLAQGQQLHPTQNPTVTDALLAGHRAPLWQYRRELKAQVFPDQLETWLSFHLARTGRPAAVLHPRVDPDQPPALLSSQQALEANDFFHHATEDRYPDIFHLAASTDQQAQARQSVSHYLSSLPQVSLRLSHGTAANIEMLTTGLEEISQAGLPSSGG